MPREGAMTLSAIRCAVAPSFGTDSVRGITELGLAGR